MTTTDTWSEAFPTLKIERLQNGLLRLEDPTENSEGYTAVLDVHPVQLRLMAERLGMLREVSVSDAALLKSERENAQRQRAEMDSLKRRLLHIRDRGLRLQENFRKYADWDHADLSDEMSQINGLVALLDMAVDDFVEDYDSVERAASTDRGESEPSGDEPASAPSPAMAPQAVITSALPAPHPQRDLLESTS